MAILSVSKENKLVVALVGISLFLALWIFIVYPDPTLKNACMIYGFMAIIGLGFYTNPAFDGYVVGIPKKNLFTSLIVGGVLGGAFVVLPRIVPGLSLGIPLIPNSVEGSLRFIVICIFAPILEEVLCRGSLLGFVNYLNKKGRRNEAIVWLAIVIQALFFVGLHFLAYSNGWYNAPTWLGATGVFANLSAVSASLILAGVFGLVTGYIVSRDGLRNLSISIVAHFIVNTTLFVGLSVAFGV